MADPALVNALKSIAGAIDAQSRELVKIRMVLEKMPKAKALEIHNSMPEEPSDSIPAVPRVDPASLLGRYLSGGANVASRSVRSDGN